MTFVLFAACDQGVISILYNHYLPNRHCSYGIFATKSQKHKEYTKLSD
jgi:hypothetical protein